MSYRSYLSNVCSVSSDAALSVMLLSVNAEHSRSCHNELSSREVIVRLIHSKENPAHCYAQNISWAL